MSRRELLQQSLTTGTAVAGSLVAVACGATPGPATTEPLDQPATAVPPLLRSTPAPQSEPHLARISFDPLAAAFAPEIENIFHLTGEEQSLLRQQGFVTSDRLTFAHFENAYAFLHWRDLPVLITTDSILQAMHQPFDSILIQSEQSLLIPQLERLLVALYTQLKVMATTNQQAKLAPLYRDLETYLAVPLVLLRDPGQPRPEAPRLTEFVTLASDARQIAEVDLFGDGSGVVDFTLFQPRGHYQRSGPLQRYFRAMSWLEHIAFRLVVAEEPSGAMRLQITQLAAVALLYEVVVAAGQQAAWHAFDDFFTALVGASDNTTLDDLTRFFRDAGVATAADVLSHPDPDQLTQRLVNGSYGRQRISGQLQVASTAGSQPTPQPISFMFLGQRFGLDSYVMSNLVFDRLIIDGRKVIRALPSPLDVMAALGNDRAMSHLQSEFATFGYKPALQKLRADINGADPLLWADSLYVRWLEVLRTLNESTTATAYPQALRTAAWADKMLQTQIASWTQLRHDTILLVKQSVTGGIVCEYPTGYVEPYPTFYAAVARYARAGAALFTGLAATDFTIPQFRDEALDHFTRLEQAATQLRDLAEKEIRHQPFTPDDIAFIKSTAVRYITPATMGCGGGSESEDIRGWYPLLFPAGDEDPGLIADVHTNGETDPGSPLYPPRVLHVATGPVTALILAVDSPAGACQYVGPTFTSFQVITEGNTDTPPKRLTDQDWDDRRTRHQLPAPPAWTQSFRIAHAGKPVLLQTPGLERAGR